MGGTVVTDLSFFSGETGGSTDCDSVTDWTGYYELDTEMKIQGTGCLTIKASNTTKRAFFDISGTVDLTGKVIYFWAMFADPLGRLGTKAQGGLGFRVESSTSDYGEWYVAGRDTWAGGWKAFAKHIDEPFDESGGALDKTAINRVAIRFTTVAGSKVTPNCYYDAIRYGTYLGIKGGTSTDPATFDEMITAENNTLNMYGVLAREEGVLLSQGKLVFGSTISGESTYFKDTSKVIVFRDLPFGEFYDLKVQGNTGTITEVYFGSEVGESGISGCAFRSAGASKFWLSASDLNITNLGLYGCSFYDSNEIKVPNTFSDQHEIEHTNFEAGSIVLAGACKFLNSNFISADSIACSIPLSHNISKCQFINNPYALYITQPGTTTFEDIVFSGNSYDVWFTGSTGETLTINLINTDTSYSKIYTPSGGTVELLLSAVHKLTGMEENTEVTYVRVDTGDVVFNVEDVGPSGITEYTYDATSPFTVDILIHHVNYVPILIENVALTSAGGEIPITQYWDRVYYNP